MIKNKHLHQFITILLVATLLTFSVGRVTRVKAVATGAAIATGVAIIVGTAFLGYLAMSGATVRYTDTSNLSDYVADVGEWVYNHGRWGGGMASLISKATDWVGRQALNAADFTIEYTKDLIAEFYNNFNNIDIFEDAISVEVPPDYTVPTLNYNYGTPRFQTIYQVNNPLQGYQYKHELLDGYGEYLVVINDYPTETQVKYMCLCMFPYEDLVNFTPDNSTNYYTGRIVNGRIQEISVYQFEPYSTFAIYQQGIRIGFSSYEQVSPSFDYYLTNNIPSYYVHISPARKMPPLANRPVYLTQSSPNNGTYEIIRQSVDVTTSQNTSVSFPDYDGGNDDDKYMPIIPYVPYPNDPMKPNGFWGALVDDILDVVADGLDLAVLSELFNRLGSDDDAITYDNDTINYYYSYDIKNIITQQSEELPIDLNELALYTNNRYLSTLSDSVENVSDVVHDYVGFWYDVDPTVVIVILGSAVLSVISLLLHKMGG